MRFLLLFVILFSPSFVLAKPLTDAQLERTWEDQKRALKCAQHVAVYGPAFQFRVIYLSCTYRWTTSKTPKTPKNPKWLELKRN